MGVGPEGYRLLELAFQALEVGVAALKGDWMLEPKKPEPVPYVQQLEQGGGGGETESSESSDSEPKPSDAERVRLVWGDQQRVGELRTLFRIPCEPDPGMIVSYRNRIFVLRDLQAALGGRLNRRVTGLLAVWEYLVGWEFAR